MTDEQSNLPLDNEDRGDGDKWEMDWNDGEEIIVHEQRPVAVYANKWGGIVIRAERNWDEDEDTVIVLASPGAAYRVIEAIQRELAANKERAK